MFNESEIALLLENSDLSQKVGELKKAFRKKSAHYLDISDHDFFSLLMLTPCIGLVMADGKISLSEELSLNKKARALSKGGYFMQKDPVVDAMKYLIRHFVEWEEEFYAIVKEAISTIVEDKGLKSLEPAQYSHEEFSRLICKAPALFNHYLATFFLKNEKKLLEKRKIKSSELEKIRHEGEKVGLGDLPIFHLFCETFIVTDKK